MTLQQVQKRLDSPKPENGQTKTKITLSDNVRNVRENDMTEIQTEMGHAAEILVESLQDVVSYWRISLRLAITVLGTVATVAVC